MSKTLKGTGKPPKKNRQVEKKVMRDYSNEPVFLKKAEEAKRFIRKHGFPDTLTIKK